jgi:citrate synthase
MSTGLRTDSLETATTQACGAPESFEGATEETQDSPDDDDTRAATPPIQEGLAGVVIGRSEICAVNGDSGTLSYRGYDIGEMACHATFEETVYLLWHGDLPTEDQLTAFTGKLTAERDIDDTTWRILTILRPSVEPMDALRTAVSSLSWAEGDTSEVCSGTSEDQAIRLVAKVPTIVAAYYRHQQGLDRIHPDPELSHAANFLYMIHGERPTETTVSSMDLAMLLMAEHGYNASTFAARVTAATLADMYSAVTTAVGTLKGPLHGGANRRAMQMMLEIGDVANVESYILDALARKERIMGFGHRVYRGAPDPRSAYLRGRLYELCAELGDFHFYELATTIAETVEAKKGLYPNVDFYAAPVLYLLGIPLSLFVPVFAASRVPGWTAHVMEQHANNRIIRPLSAYVGPENRTYLPIDQR